MKRTTHKLRLRKKIFDSLLSFGSIQLSHALCEIESSLFVYFSSCRQSSENREIATHMHELSLYIVAMLFCFFATGYK
jgi:hypothetical protein